MGLIKKTQETRENSNLFDLPFFSFLRKAIYQAAFDHMSLVTEIQL
jgi:hypothetical protein